MWLLGGGRGRGEAVFSLEAEESRTLLQGARPLEVAEIGNRLVWSRVVGRKRRYKEREKEKERKRQGKARAWEALSMWGSGSARGRFPQEEK